MRLFLFAFFAAMLGASELPRLVVLTDIGGDPDDTQSMIRLMVYAQEFEIEGLIASASGTPGELKEKVVRPELIREVVKASKNDALLRVVKAGDAERGVHNLGQKSDTEGSRWIISVVDKPDPKPVNITIWGGAHDLAQALWRVRNDRKPAEVDKFVAKLRVHSIGHQDETGPWILENFPKLFFILSSADQADVFGKQKGKIDRRQSVYRGMYLGGDESLTSREWIEANVKSQGPLGALYPMKTWTAPNPHSCMKEGDTPSWFYFLPNGLTDPEHPEWGGWGGRFRRVRDQFFNDAPEGRESVYRWRPAFQADFAARMRGLRPKAEAPRKVEVVRARAGERVKIQGSGWRHYKEPGGQTSEVTVGSDFTPPEAGEYHLIREISDRGLVSYRRLIVRVEPAR